MEIFLIFVCLGFITALIAGKKGRNGLGWWLYGALLFPVALVHSLVASDLNRSPCPSCGEPVLKTAMVCPHCRQQIESERVLKQVERAPVILEGDPDALAKSAIGDTVALVIERQDYYPARLRVESPNGTLGYLRGDYTSEILALLERQAHRATIDGIKRRSATLSIRIFSRAAEKPP